MFINIYNNNIYHMIWYIKQLLSDVCLTDNWYTGIITNMPVNNWDTELMYRGLILA